MQPASIPKVREILLSYMESKSTEVYNGLLAVWDQLLLPITKKGTLSVVSYILFKDALELFLGYCSSYIPDTELREHRLRFRDTLLNKDYGLRVNIIRINSDAEYIVLRSDNFDLEQFCSEITGMRAGRGICMTDLGPEFLQKMLLTVSSESDKGCLKLVLAATRSRGEIQSLGIDPDNIQN